MIRFIPVHVPPFPCFVAIAISLYCYFVTIRYWKCWNRQMRTFRPRDSYMKREHFAEISSTCVFTSISMKLSFSQSSYSTHSSQFLPTQALRLDVILTKHTANVHNVASSIARDSIALFPTSQPRMSSANSTFRDFAKSPRFRSSHLVLRRGLCQEMMPEDQDLKGCVTSNLPMLFPTTGLNFRGYLWRRDGAEVPLPAGRIFGAEY